jgi:hypothetical protein
MKNIFNKSLVKFLFVFAVLLISSHICSAAVVVTVSASPASVVTGNTSYISWVATGTTYCSESGGRGGHGATGGFWSGALTTNTTFTVTCVGTTVACYDGIYQSTDSVHPNGGNITYTLGSGLSNTINYIYKYNPVKIEYKTGTSITKLAVSTVTCP